MTSPILVVAIGLVATLSACLGTAGAPATDTRPAVPKVINGCMGGSLALHYEELQRVNRLGIPVELHGQIDSACTMFLGANDVCLGDTADLGFHGATDWYGLGREAYGTEIMAQQYNAELRAWFYRKAAHLKLRFERLEADKLHDRFGYRLCD